MKACPEQTVCCSSTLSSYSFNPANRRERAKGGKRKQEKKAGEVWEWLPPTGGSGVAWSAVVVLLGLRVTGAGGVGRLAGVALCRTAGHRVVLGRFEKKRDARFRGSAPALAA